jgi:hypothetical protein
MSIDSEADPGTGARAYEVMDAAGEVRDSGAVTFVFADDGLLNGATLPLEVGADFGVDFSAARLTSRHPPTTGSPGSPQPHRPPTEPTDIGRNQHGGRRTRARRSTLCPVRGR